MPFKVYSELEGMAPPPDLERLCLYSNGVLRWRRYPDGEVFGFRAAACTGALYHIELYLACAERDDLAAGLYQYGAHDGMLRLLRQGDVRGALLEASGFPAMVAAPLVVLLTSTFWRNSWKYEARAYRHAFWDGGTVLANLLALAAEDRQRAEVVMGFADEAVNRLLGVDGRAEAAIALVTCGEGARQPAGVESLPELQPTTVPLSRRPIDYPEIEAAHAASSLPSGESASGWRAAVQSGAEAFPRFPGFSLAAPVEEVIRRRRSAREFTAQTISRSELDSILRAASASIPGDSFAPGLVEPFLIVNAVEGLAAGAYTGNLSVIKIGDFRVAAFQLALGQELAALAAVNIYFLADLEAVFQRFGERGYRVAQMAGGIAGGRVELAATALGLGATGLTFFDDDVTRFFEPEAQGRQVMYLAAVGHMREEFLLKEGAG